MGQNPILQSALRYRGLGFSVIPVSSEDKTPLIKWTIFQKFLATEEEIVEWWNLYPNANVGIVTGAVSCLVVIDIDDLEVGEPALQGILGDVICPTCQTPSGGQHLFFRAPGLTPPNNTRLIPGCDFRGEGGFVVAVPSVSDAGPYVWLPGMALGEIPLPTLPDAYLDAIRAATAPKVTQEAAGQPVLTKGRRNADIFSIAFNLLAGGMFRDRALDIILHLARSATPPYPEAEARRSFASACERAAKGSPQERSVAEEVEELINKCYMDGTFRVTWLTKELQGVTALQTGTDRYKALQNNIRQVIHRLRTDGIIEPSGRMSGEYRRVNRDLAPIDFLTAPTDKIDVAWPFGLEDLVDTYPKNLIVVSGESDTGKTAFLLNFLEMNMDRHKITYYSSEMGATEMRARLEKFDRPLDTWNFKAVERAGQFADVINPDEISIVDFLEISDEFWKIGGFMKAIFDKLRNGICLIGLQKAPGTDVGRGGVGSLEKARLYLSISRNKDGTGRLKITKGKNWKDSRVNPNNRFKDFHLVGGCKFVIKNTEWQRDY